MRFLLIIILSFIANTVHAGRLKEMADQIEYDVKNNNGDQPFVLAQVK